jgi:hypothetical protein
MTLALVVAGFVVASGSVGVGLVLALRRARADGATGSALVGRLLPFLALDTALVVALAAYLALRH